MSMNSSAQKYKEVRVGRNAVRYHQSMELSKIGLSVNLSTLCMKRDRPLAIRYQSQSDF
jgi:hypothetical protein